MEKITTKEQVIETLGKILMDKLYAEKHEVEDLESSLTNDLGADSLDCVEIVMRIEEVFGIRIPDSDVETYYEPKYKIKSLVNNICTHLKIEQN